MSLTAQFRDVPVKRKLMFIAFLSAGAALLFAMMVLAGQEWITARSEMAFNMSRYAEIISTTSTTALLSDDRKVATKLMDTLSTMDEVESAVIYDKEGHPFASYVRSGLAAPPPDKIPAGNQHFFSAGHFELFHAIVSGNAQVGTLHIHANLAPLYKKIFLNMAILLAAMLGGLGIAWVLVARLHTIITQPISALIGLMAQVSSENDYTLRAIPEGKDELGLLAEKFNGMLAQIQARDDALAQQQELVAQRTAELIQSEKKFRSISASAKDAIVTIDNEGNIYYWNTGAEAIFGYSEEEALGKELHTLLAPERFHEAYWQGFSHFKNTGEGPVIGKTLELAALRKGGAEFPIELSLSAVKIGNKWSAIGIIRDITERKLAEEQIHTQQELTTQIIETIPMRVFWKDRNLRYMGCNTAFAQDAGKNRPGDLIGMDDFQMVWRDQAEIYRTDDRQVIDTNTPKLSYDEPLTISTGERVWLRTSKVPLHDEAGKVIGVLGTYEDITKRKHIEIALRQSEERFRMAFQNSAIGMALITVDGRWLQVNDALCRILGYAEQELMRRTFQDITHPDDLESDLDFMAQLLAGKIDHYQMEKRYFHKEGHIVWALLTVSLLRDTQGNPIHFICQIEDITEDKQVREKIRKLNEDLEIKVQERTRQLLDAQEELVRKEKLAVLGQVAGSVGHELRNPLGVMSNAVYFLQTVLSDADETINEYLGIIKSEIEASERIVSDLLDSVRTKPPHPETIGIAELIGQTLNKCVIPPFVDVKLDIPAILPPLRVDAMQIHQVLRNLITNAVEAMPEGGILEIRAAKNEAEKVITISVRDTGIGITPEQLGRLFQPLFTTKARGIGLGLVVVKNLTEANGGRVEVQSEPSKGAAFSIIFHYEMENSA